MNQPEVNFVREQFGATAANRVDALYQAPDIVAQRAAVLTRLALQPGEHVLDVGSGPGLLAEAIAAQVGSRGSVLGVDLSDSMCAIARERCRHQPWARFEGAEAAQLPISNDVFDVVVCTQVLEYVADVERAIRELHRVMRPGGRFLVMDTDWQSCVWSTSDSDRMRAILNEWDQHCVHPQLPRSLKHRLIDAGLHVQVIEVVPIINAEFDSNTYSAGMIEVIAKFVTKAGRIPADQVSAWARELSDPKRPEPYFFSLNRYVFSGTS